MNKVYKEERETNSGDTQYQHSFDPSSLPADLQSHKEYAKEIYNALEKANPTVIPLTPQDILWSLLTGYSLTAQVLSILTTIGVTSLAKKGAAVIPFFTRYLDRIPTYDFIIVLAAQNIANSIFQKVTGHPIEALNPFSYRKDSLVSPARCKFLTMSPAGVIPNAITLGYVGTKLLPGKTEN